MHGIAGGADGAISDYEHTAHSYEFHWRGGGAINLEINANRLSKEYKYNLSEIRVKSIISNGYIKLF